MYDYQGQFIWYELLTSDAAAATDFYRAVMGWKAQSSGTPGMDYTILSVGDRGMGGLMKLPQDACDQGARPNWVGYIAVNDVDAYVTRVVEAGGQMHRAAADIPGVGRFALVADPQGAVFVLFKGASKEGPEPPAGGTPGYTGWHELYANDHEKAFAFYAQLFGWTKRDAVDMGPMGVYQLFATRGDVAVGGMMNRPPHIPMACWLYYFNVPDINVALETVKRHAGQVLNGPMQVPGGSWIAQCMDPQGAAFALVAPAPMA